MDSTRELRWSIGLFLIFLAVVPVIGASGWIPVLVAMPINLAGVAVAAFGMASHDPATSARRLWLAAVLILAGDIALYSLNSAAR